MESTSQILPRRVIRPGVCEATGGRQALMAERLLDEVGRGATVEGVGGVGVPKPVRGDAIGGAGAPGRFI